MKEREMPAKVAIINASILTMHHIVKDHLTPQFR